MAPADNEEELLRSVALQNARTILLARERAEKSLREATKELERKNEDFFQQREWFKVTLSSIGDGVITTDAAGRLTFLNPVAEKLTGWSAAEAVGLPLEQVFVIFHEQTHQPVENPVIKALHDGVVVSLADKHTVLQRRDGTTVPIEDSAAPIRDSEGRVSGAVMVFHDVTDRRQRDEVLWRLAAVIESSDDAILSMSLEAIITTWNAGAERMYGYTAQEIIGKSVNILIPPDRIDEEPEILERLKKGERIDHYETIRRTKAGEDLYVSLTVSPIIDFAGTIIGASKISRNMTRRKRDEEALREESKILELLNDTGMAIASNLDLQTLVQTATDAGTKLSGAQFGAFFYNVTNAEGESYLLYTLSGAPREAFEKFGMPRNTPVFAPTFSGQGVVRSDDITKDARYGTMSPHFGMPPGHLPVRSYLAVPVISRSGQVIGGLFFGHAEPGMFNERSERLLLGIAAQTAIALDNARLYDAAQKELAERKRAEEALRQAQEKLSQHAENLEKQVAERTADLRQKIAELEAFSYSVSHDLRAPVRAVQSYALILAEECGAKVNAEEKEFLRRISSAAERMDRLIQDVLSYSRMSRADVVLEPIDLEKLLRGIVESYPMFQPPSGLVELEGPFPPVLGADALLTQCVSNILGNAVKFVAPGVTPKVRVWAETMPGGEKVRVYFQDNGLGIPPAAHERIFRIFERMNNNYEGTGIGLSIVQKGVDLMKGAVGVQSKPGQGSTFWLELNCAKQRNK